MVKELDIQTLLHGSAVITESEKNQLTELADQFPWSQSIQQAWLKALYQTKDSRFKKELERVAFISSDRRELYHLIYGQALQKTISKVEKEIEQVEAGTFTPEWKKTDEQETSVSLESKATSDSDKPKDILHALERKETAKTEIELVSEQQELEQDADVPEIKIGSDLIPELAEQIKLTAADAIISKEVLDDIKVKKEETLRKTAQPEVEEKTVLESISSDDFINWLVNKASEVEYPSFERQNYKKPKSGKPVESLIDNFISNDPKITRGKAREYGLEDLAKESLVDNEEFVTETLAEIYASQGNFNKAKRAFELLSLKYPEKSIYFAARIKKLGKKK